MQQKIQKKSADLMLSVILLCLFLSTINFIDRYYFAVYIGFGLFCLYCKGRIQTNLFASACLLVLGVSWVIFSPNTMDSVFAALKPFTYILLYMMGFTLVGSEDREETVDEKRFLLLIGILAAGTFAHYILNWLTNVATYKSRDTIDIWTEEILSATGQAALAVLPMGLAAAGLFSKNSVKIKLVCLGLVAVIVAYNLILSGRTLFLMLIIIVAVAFLHRLAVEKKTRTRTVLSFVLIIAAVFVAYNVDFLGIRTAFKNSLFYDRFFGDYKMDLDEDTRMESKLYYLKYMLEYPWGGLHMRKMVGYAHDIFLDTYDEAGIFALIGMVLFLLQALGNVWRCLHNKHLSFGLRQTVLCTYVLILVEFMIEPILQGMPWLFASLCFIDGALRHLLIREKTLSLNSVQTNSR